MPQIDIRIDGDGGQFKDLFQRCEIFEMPHSVPIRMETLDHGMEGGNPSLAIFIEMPLEDAGGKGLVVVAQTSVKLLQMAALTTLAKYGDMTNGGIMAILQQGETAEITLSSAAECPSCHKRIPGSCKYCHECGAKL